MVFVPNIFGSDSVADFKSFDWEKMFNKFVALAPTFSSILLSATKCRRNHNNKVAIICLCVGIVLKYRCKKISFIQKVIGLVLYASSCPKKVNSK